MSLSYIPAIGLIFYLIVSCDGMEQKGIAQFNGLKNIEQRQGCEIINCLIKNHIDAFTLQIRGCFRTFSMRGSGTIKNVELHKLAMETRL